MEPRIDVITLAVADLERAVAFYREGLGLESRGVIGTEFVGDEVEPNGAIAMFELQGGMILCLYPRTELAKGTFGRSSTTHGSSARRSNRIGKLEIFSVG